MANDHDASLYEPGELCGQNLFTNFGANVHLLLRVESHKPAMAANTLNFPKMEATPMKRVVRGELVSDVGSSKGLVGVGANGCPAGEVLLPSPPHA